MVGKSSPKKRSAVVTIIRKGHVSAYCNTKGKCFSSTKVSPKCVVKRGACPKGQILRMGYVRKAYTRISPSGKVIRVKATRVPAKCIKDQGKPGRGRKVISMKNGVSLRDFGYMMSASQAMRRKALRDAIKVHGKAQIKERLVKLSILFSNRPQLKIINNDLSYLR